jgi:uncharacterized membrane protein (DUF485 family)
MNTIKRILGLVWILAGPCLLAFLILEALKKNALPTATANDLLQWSIIIGIFIPIVVGFMIFGYYSFKGEYDLDERNL